MSEQNKLFEEFPPVSTKEWMDKITADLKGADFNKKLVWKTNEGFDVMPFYRKEDIEGLSHLSSEPGEYPYLRGSRKSGNNWRVRQNIDVRDYKEANKKALDILMKGVDSLGFIIEDAESVTEENLETLLNGIHFESVEINFQANGKAKEILGYLRKAIDKAGTSQNDITGSVEADPLARLMINGALCVSVSEGLDYLASLAQEASSLPRFRTIRVNAANFTNAGCDIVKELAFSLSMANEYLNQLTERGISSDLAASKICFNFGTGSNYFFEIARIRAARFLWSVIVSGYKTQNAASSVMEINCTTSRWNKTLYDPFVNLLRTQTEAMSAILGGTDSLTVEPFDLVFRKPNDFSERIARNQQLLLKEEAYFDKTADPAGGSYYIEKLTSMISESAWKLFIEIEEQGGFLAALKNGFIQQSVKKSADIRISDVARKKEILLGTNQHPDFKETISPPVELGRLLKREDIQKEKILEPVRLFRGSEEFERLRMTVDSSSRKPVVFLLTIGNQAMRKARAQFACNFFAAGGYKVIDNNGFATSAEGVEAGMAANADIIVVCSSDEEYAVFAREVFEMVAQKAIVVVAGNPPCMEELKSGGIGFFISVRSDVTAMLKMFNEKLGIRLG